MNHKCFFNLLPEYWELLLIVRKNISQQDKDELPQPLTKMSFKILQKLTSHVNKPTPDNLSKY